MKKPVSHNQGVGSQNSSFLRSRFFKFALAFFFLVVVILSFETFYYWKLKKDGQVDSGVLDQAQQKTLPTQPELKKTSFAKDLVDVKLSGKILEIDSKNRIIKIEYKDKKSHLQKQTQITLNKISWFPKEGEYNPDKAPHLEELVNKEGLEFIIKGEDILEIYY